MVRFAFGLEFRLGCLPLALDFFVGKGAETHTPPFKNHNPHRGLTSPIDDAPFAFRGPIARAAEGRFVVRGDFDIRFPLIDSAEEVRAEFDIVGGGLAAVLDQGV